MRLLQLRREGAGAKAADGEVVTTVVARSALPLSSRETPKSPIFTVSFAPRKMF